MAEQDAKKRTMEYVAVGALVLIAVFIGISRFKKKEADDEVFSRTRFNEEWKEVEILESKLPEEEKGISYMLDGETSPFKSPLTDKKKIQITDVEVSLPSSLSFQGMIWNSKRPQAIINNKVYDVNDIVEIESEELTSEKIKIVDVTREGIYLRYKGKDFLVRPK